jgi:probable LLM family oxidoreductase
MMTPSDTSAASNENAPRPPDIDMPRPLEFGLDTFGDVTVAANGRAISQAETLRQVVAEAILADELGVDVFGVGEHHRPDFAVSAPEVMLAAIAGRTSRIALGSAVTVLSTDDPVRVFQRFSTLNAVSNGRAEVILGRGSFTESYPLFGYDLSQYNELFEEKVGLFVKLISGGAVTWSGRSRSGLTDQVVHPPLEKPLRTWIGVGGSPESVVRAARYGLPLTLAIIGGDPLRFQPYADLFRRSLEQLGKAPLPVAVHSPGHVAETDEQAKNELWPHYERMMNRIGAERGWSPTSRAQFEREAGPGGALCVGSPVTVAAKIARTIQALGLSRFSMKYSAGTLSHDRLMASIELFATKVIPRVRDLVAAETPGEKLEAGRGRGITPSAAS